MDWCGGILLLISFVFVVSIVHKFALVAKSLIALVHVVQDRRAHHASDLLGIAMAVAVTVCERRRGWRKVVALGMRVGGVPVACPQLARGRWRTLTKTEMRPSAVQVCAGEVMWCPWVVVEHCLMEGGCRVPGGRTRRNGSRSRSMVARHVHIHHGSVCSRFRVDVGVVRVIDAHQVGVDIEGLRVSAPVLVREMSRIVEMVAQSANTVAGKDTKDVSLVIVKLRRGVAAEAQKILAKECLDAGEGEVCELGAVVQEAVNSLKMMLVFIFKCRLSLV